MDSYRTLIVLVLLLFVPAWGAPELVVGTGHSQDVTCVAWSGDGRLIATGGKDGSVRLWNARTGQELRAFTGQPRQVDVVAFSPDGKLIASGGQDDTVRLWAVADGQSRYVLQGPGFVTCLAFSSDSQGLISGGQGLALWDLRTGRQVERLPNLVWWVALAGKHLVTADWDGLRVDDRTLPHESRIFSLGCHGDTLAVGGQDGRVRLTDLTGHVLHTLEGPMGTVYDVAFSPDGKTVAAASRGPQVDLWDVASGSPLPPLPVASVDRLAWSPAGNAVVTASLGDHAAQVWNLPTRQSLSLHGHAVSIDAIALSPRWQTLAVSSGDKLRLLDVASGRLRTLPCPSSEALAFNQDSTLLAAGGSDGTIRLWDVARGQTTVSLAGHERRIRSLAFHEGRLASGSDDMDVRVWDLKTRESQVLHGYYRGAVLALAWSPDGRRLASGDLRIHVWNLARGDEEAVLEHGRGIHALAFSPDGTLLASADEDKSVALWDGDKVVRTLPGHAAHETLRLSNIYTSLAFSPDGRTLLSGSEDRQAVLWDVATGQRLSVLKGHVSDDITYVSFSPDGRLMATASYDNTLRLWDQSKPLATVVALDAQDWLVVSPSGLFDGSPGGWRRVLWRFNHATFDTAEPEQYFNEFYHPGLLSDLIRDGHELPAPSLEKKDRRLPRLSISAPPRTDRRSIQVQVRIESAPAGAQDVRLFRNGTLVTRWSGPKPLGVLTTSVTVVSGPNTLTAYAFNTDNVKSPDATATVVGADSLKRAPADYVLCIGIDRYSDPQYNLTYAASDARTLAKDLESRLPGQPVSVEVLQDEHATRHAILQALRRLSLCVQPEDVVVVAYSGHGTLQGGHFVLIPHDMAHGLSDTDLEAALLPLQSQHTVLILDACHSGGALDSDEWRRGPLNARGLVQLAWEKGMEVVAASQARQVALELARLGSGLLTYALDQTLLANPALLTRDWLDTSAAAVPHLLDAVPVRSLFTARTVERWDRSGVPPPAIQLPRVFHRREDGGTWPISR